MEITWKTALIGTGIALGLGFGAGRWTNQPTITTVVDTKTSEIRVEDKKVVAEVVDNKAKTVDKGPVKTVTKKKTTMPSGEVEEEETVVEEGATKTSETTSSASKTVSEDHSKTVVKNETHSETTSTPPRNWLLGVSADYGVKDAITRQWTKPDVAVHIGYRIFGGVYAGVGGGYDFSNKNVKVGAHLNFTF